jgi:serine/threonine protein kinase
MIKYPIIKELGKGPLGIVLLAKDNQAEQPVVVRRLVTHLAGRSNLKLQVMRDARRAAKLTHPNIAAILDVGEYEGSPYLVSEYIDGISLGELIRKEMPLPISKAVALMAGILKGVAHAHRHGFLHLNLNPSRIIVDKKDIPRITNFGISVMILALKSAVETTAYLSPEHFSKTPLSPRSDIFSLGLIFYELLTGKPACGSPENIAEYDRTVIPLPAHLNPDIDPQLQQIILKALEHKPELRYADAQEMISDMEAFGFAVDGCGDDTLNTSQSTIDTLLRLMERSQDFPAFSQHLLEINQKASLSASNLTSPAQLAGVILKDYSLTNKLLRLVNSAFYGSFAGNITTITKAVMVLGFEQVSLAASSLMLFDHLQNKSQSEELKDAAISSFMSGLVARDMADSMGIHNLEESFICAMLHNLGRHLVIYYLPDQARSIKSIMTQKGESERNAAWSVLRISYEDIGMAVLKTWNFPEKIVGSQTRLPDGNIDKPKSDEAALQCLAGYANDVCEAVRNHQGAARTAALKALAKRFQKVVPVSETQLTKMLNTARIQMEKYSDVLGVNVRLSEFMQRLAMDAEPAGEKTAEKPSLLTAAEDATEISVMGKLVSDAAIREDRADILISGIQEITNSLLSDYLLNDMMFMILETIYRGFDFKHVIFCMMEMSRTKMRARYAFGADLKSVTENFAFTITHRPTDLFNIAISQQKDIVVEDSQEPAYTSLIPDWYRKAFLAPAFIIYPIIIKETPFGLIYADKASKGNVLTQKQLNYMKTLRNQAILAIRQKI